MSRLFLTGASGFIGRHLVPQLLGAHDSVSALAHDSPVETPGVNVVRGRLLEPATWRSALDGIDTIVHLAAAVGKADRATFFRINTDGTKLLLDEAEKAGVRRFLFISSIAAGYTDTAFYHYAHSKQAAEEAVRSSSLASLIIRPTIVLGRGSSIGQRFRSLGAAPIVPVFGDGRARIQPVHVDDLAAIIVSRLSGDAFGGRTVEAGGPDTLTMEEMLRRIHRSIHAKDARVVHLPVGMMRGLLGRLETISPALAPVTAGQLAAFCNDGTAADDPASLAPGHPFVPVDRMIAEIAADG
jgi:uncharacterized protein YbjT (DUF2867 family)